MFTTWCIFLHPHCYPSATSLSHSHKLTHPYHLYLHFCTLRTFLDTPLLASSFPTGVNMDLSYSKTPVPASLSHFSFSSLRINPTSSTLSPSTSQLRGLVSWWSHCCWCHIKKHPVYSVKWLALGKACRLDLLAPIQLSNPVQHGKTGIKLQWLLLCVFWVSTSPHISLNWRSPKYSLSTPGERVLMGLFKGSIKCTSILLLILYVPGVNEELRIPWMDRWSKMFGGPWLKWKLLSYNSSNNNNVVEHIEWWDFTWIHWNSRS